MIKRIVKMTFKPEQVAYFLENFENVQPKIEEFPGCQKVELYHQSGKENVLFTLSHWQSEADLEAYRQSELFQGTWVIVKKMFADKAEAWTLLEQDLKH